MTYYRFIKVTNNDNHEMYFIDATKMQDPRIRVGILYSSFLKHLEESKACNNIHAVLDSDYSFYCCYRCNCNTYKEVNATRDQLYEFYNEKLYNKVETDSSND